MGKKWVRNLAAVTTKLLFRPCRVLIGGLFIATAAIRHSRIWKEKLGAPVAPKEVAFVTELPKTKSGKILE